MPGNCASDSTFRPNRCSGNQYSRTKLRTCASLAATILRFVCARASLYNEESAVNDDRARSRKNRSLVLLLLGGVLALIGIVLAVGGAWLAILGGSLYYLLAGLGLLRSVV